VFTFLSIYIHHDIEKKEGDDGLEIHLLGMEFQETALNIVVFNPHLI